MVPGAEHIFDCSQAAKGSSQKGYCVELPLWCLQTSHDPTGRRRSNCRLTVKLALPAPTGAQGKEETKHGY